MTMTRIICLLMLFSWSMVAYCGEPVDCVYCAKHTKANPNPELKDYKNCGEITAGKISLTKEHLAQMDFDKHRLATILVQGKHYYVKPDGSMLQVVTFDNWADDYSEGLVRSMVDGRVAYYNRAFKQVIAPKYDWGGPFIKGRALVCKGCTVQPPDEDGHTSYTGGTWGYIDKKGHEVIPVRFTRSEADRK